MGLVTRRHGSASNRKTTPRQDLHIIIQARRTPFATARHIQQDLQNVTSLLVSDHTIRNRLWEEGTRNVNRVNNRRHYYDCTDA
ncbi:hypothetical protein C0J52_01227 [Blattella germanica]|nr:hypothetical protein C0J52_01227 [Blattella germanica]